MYRKIIEDFDKKEKSRKQRRDDRRDRGSESISRHSSSHRESSSFSTHSRPSSSRHQSSSSSSHRNHHHSKHDKSSSSKHHHKKHDEDIKPSLSQYRDRAKERREGLNKDFEIDPDDFKITNPVMGLPAANPIEGKSNPDDPNNEESLRDEKERRLQLIEESKYLGGDVEHTHLVKGLDFALLEKIKNDQKVADKLALEGITDDKNLMADDSDTDEEEFQTRAILAASTGSSNQHLLDLEKLKKGKSTEIIQCWTVKARKILDVLDEKYDDKSDLFLPGRMNYIIPVVEPDDDYNSNNLGGITTVLRSKVMLPTDNFHQ